MQKRKLIITQDVDHDYVQEIKQVIPEWDVFAGKDPNVWKNHLNDAEIIAGWKKEIKEYSFNEESKLKWLQVWSAGINSLPLEDLESRNIQLTSAGGVHAYPISETIFALMLSLTRKIHNYGQLPTT